MDGVPCGVVVVEERDTRGSSVRRSRRTGTVVYATVHGPGGGRVGNVEKKGVRGAATLELVGDAGTEAYAFQRDRCRIFRSFLGDGKLTVCTEGMRHQIMMSEADPRLLKELCGILMGEEEPHPPPTPSNSDLPSRSSAARTRTRPRPGQAKVVQARARPPSLGRGLLQARDINAPTSSKGGSLSPLLSSEKAKKFSGRVQTSASSRPPVALGKERRMGTPTKSECARVPERKSTRKFSPQKNGKPVPPAELPLSKDQQKVVDLVAAGKSIFFTGCAGTGKSLVLNRILRCLKEDGTAGVHATATTGLASSHVKGTTLQQFAGIGKASGSGEELVRIVRKRPDAVRRWRTVQVLIVDEISMLDGDTFDALEYVARELRKNPTPFGGVRLVLSGDFFQLPPVSRKGEPAKKLCFEAAAWKACVQETVELKLVFRQRDVKFVKLLSRIRWGQCTPEVLADLRSCSNRRLAGEDGIEETLLLTHKADVLRVNEERLGKLEGSEVVARAQDRCSRPEYRRQLDEACSAPETLRLKVGAQQVILVKNLSTGRGMANGSRAVVVRFATLSGARLPVLRFTSGLEDVIRPEEFNLYVGGLVVATRRQLPLALAWALSVHKSQGMSLDRASVCLSRAFEYGQAYVALSRVRSLEGLSVVGTIDPDKIRAHPRVVSFYRALKQQSISKRLDA
ncbi:unnamed protein product [Ascophyllum nodosum]